jgi:ketosteroid isomerase-like protein
MPLRKPHPLALAAAALLVVGAPPAMSAQPTYGPRYAQDRAEIEDLMSRYLFAMDYGDFDAYVETFTEDGVLEFSRSTSRGRAEIKKAVAVFKEAIGKLYKDKEGNPATLRHVLLQAVIRVEADHAWTRSLWVEMANDGANGTLKMGTFGIYEDELQRVKGHWLFSRRRVLNEFLEGRHSGPDNPVRDLDGLAAAFLAK